MKKRIKRLGAFLLAGICVFSITLSMAGCSENKTGNAADKGSSQAGNAGTGSDVGDGGAAGAKGCYVESDLTTPSGLKKLTNLSRLEDNSLAILDIENGMLHISKDEGKNWEGKEIPIVSELVKNQSGDGLEFLANAVAKDGGVFYGFRNWGDEGGDYSPHYYYMQNDGQAQEISLSGGNISQAVFAETALYMARTEKVPYIMWILLTGQPENCSKRIAYLILLWESAVTELQRSTPTRHIFAERMIHRQILQMKY